MNRNILDEIYERILYPSEEIQSLILAAERQMQERWEALNIPDTDKENLMDIFVDNEQKVRKAIFSAGFRLGLDVMLEYLKSNPDE